MLSLPGLHNLLSQFLHLPELHTIILFTATGQLISTAYDTQRPKDDVYVVGGIIEEVWKKTREEGIGMVESELGRILVVAIDSPPEDLPEPLPEDHQPLMLLCLNSTDAISWEDLQSKGKTLASHLAKPLSQFREHLAAKPAPVSPSNTRQQRHRDLVRT